MSTAQQREKRVAAAAFGEPGGSEEAGQSSASESFSDAEPSYSSDEDGRE